MCVRYSKQEKKERSVFLGTALKGIVQYKYDILLDQQRGVIVVF